MVIDDGRGDPVEVPFTWSGGPAGQTAAAPAHEQAPAQARDQPSRPGGRRRARRPAPTSWAMALPLLLVVPLGAGVAVAATGMDRTRVRQVANRYAAGWEQGSLDGLIPPAAVQSVRDETRSLTRDGHPAQVRVRDDTSVSGDHATQGLDVEWHLDDGTVWSYRTMLALTKSGNHWAVAWSPQSVHPALQQGTVLHLDRLVTPRGQVLGADAQVLVTARKVVRIFIRPSKLNWMFLGRLDVATVARILGLDGDALQSRVDASPDEALVDVTTLTEPQWAAVASRVQDIPGIVVQHDQQPLAPSPGFARTLLGSAVTSTTAQTVNGRQVNPGEYVGTSGLQKQYDAWLAGTPGDRISVVPQAGSGLTLPQAVLFTRPASSGRALVTTIDPRVQNAADAAVAPAGVPAALVAIDTATGNVLAVADGGLGDHGDDRALLGRYPPGGTFTLASTLALIDGGMFLDEPMSCPASVEIGGATFAQARPVAGAAPFSQQFVRHCSTAFVALANRTDATSLTAAGRSLGYEAPLLLGTPAFAGEVPSRSDQIGHAASMIGQGPVLASPLTVAAATAAVASGRYRAPRLVTMPAVAAGSAGTALDPVAANDLRGLLRSAVTSGESGALSTLRTVAGGPVSGQVGVADRGPGIVPVGWCTGYQGDVAFAVLLDGGTRDGDATAAVAVARDFLTRLNGGTPSAAPATVARPSAPRAAPRPAASSSPGASSASDPED